MGCGNVRNLIPRRNDGIQGVYYGVHVSVHGKRCRGCVRGALDSHGHRSIGTGGVIAFAHQFVHNLFVQLAHGGVCNRAVTGLFHYPASGGVQVIDFPQPFFARAAGRSGRQGVGNRGAVSLDSRRCHAGQARIHRVQSE